MALLRIYQKKPLRPALPTSPRGTVAKVYPQQTGDLTVEVRERFGFYHLAINFHFDNRR